MISIGNFFFKYRNWLFIVLYAALFIPSPLLFSPGVFGQQYFIWPIMVGLTTTIFGQLIRGATIGLAYIIRGGNNGKVFAEHLVTNGIFNHCRNPLYAGNILMLTGVGILANSLVFICIVIPIFLFIYQTIVLAEEHFLLNKFGNSFAVYCSLVNRWLPNLKGLRQTFKSLHFNWKRWLIKEYNTQYVWLTGISLILLYKFPQLTSYNTLLRNTILVVVIPFLLFLYLLVRFLKKTRRVIE